jgi:hypothetical protein
MKGFPLFAALTIAAAADAEPLALTDRFGHTVRVEVAAVTSDTLEYLDNGRRGQVPLADLAEESRKAALDFARAHQLLQTFPPVQVQVVVGFKRVQSNDVWYQKNMTLQPSFTMEGARRTAPLPAARASVVIITQNTREKYAKGTEKLTVYSTETMDIAAAKDGERRALSFAPVKMHFDAWRDSSNVGGEEYKYYIFGLRDAATGQLIHFRTNSPQIEGYAAQHPDSRDALLALKKDAPFSPQNPLQ